MNADELKKTLGENYPAEIALNGEVLTLSDEQRFSRTFSRQDGSLSYTISRFMDKSASFSAKELEQEWPTWPESLRREFADNCHWLKDQEDAPEIARFLAVHGDESVWELSAMFIATALNQEEAFQLLSERLSLSTDDMIDILWRQCIAATKHPQAQSVLREELEKLKSGPSVWADDDFFNWPACAVTCCIEHLLELGAKPADFEATVLKLAQHPCAGNRQSCQSSLAKYYDWIEKE
jgi:hypothetical protein